MEGSEYFTDESGRRWALPGDTPPRDPPAVGDYYSDDGVIVLFDGEAWQPVPEFTHSWSGGFRLDATAGESTERQNDG